MKGKIITLLLVLFGLFAHHSAAAFSAIHIPIGADQAAWRDAVCATMTESGCAYFSAYEAEPAWSALKALDATGADIHVKERVIVLSDDLELRRLEVIVFTAAGERQAHTVYATVMAGTQLLDRVVMLDGVLLDKEQ